MSFLWFGLIGLAAGWLAGLIMRSRPHGLVVDLVIGVTGATLGGWAFRILGLAAISPMGHLVIATVGATVLIASLRAWANHSG